MQTECLSQVTSPVSRVCYSVMSPGIRDFPYVVEIMDLKCGIVILVPRDEPSASCEHLKAESLLQLESQDPTAQEGSGVRRTSTAVVGGTGLGGQGYRQLRGPEPGSAGSQLRRDHNPTSQGPGLLPASGCVLPPEDSEPCCPQTSSQPSYCPIADL